MVKKVIKYLIVLTLMISLFFLSFLIPSREPKKADYLILNLTKEQKMDYPINYQCTVVGVEKDIMVSNCYASNKDWICNLKRDFNLTSEITQNQLECTQCWASYGDECIVPIKNQTTGLNS